MRNLNKNYLKNINLATLIYFLIFVYLNKSYGFSNNSYQLTKKIITDKNVIYLEPTLKYLHNVPDSAIDWTTSLPILEPTISARTAGAKSCLDNNLHTYYNTDINSEIMELIKEYFKNKDINCSINNIKIRYTSFDILRDIYESMHINANDKILIIAPTYGYYLIQAAEANLETSLLFTKKENDWKITPTELDKALKEIKPKILIFTNPVNPTGIYYNKNEVENLASVIKKHNVFTISDEIFSEIYFDENNKPFSIAAVSGMQERTIVLSGLGKSRGVRFSFACVPVDIISTLPSSGVLLQIQAAAVEVLKSNLENQTYLKQSISMYKEHINFILNKINAINDSLNLHYKTKGSIYLRPYLMPKATNIFLLSFAGIKGMKLGDKTINSSLELAEYLLNHAGIAMVPGEGFFIEKDDMVLRIPISIHIKELEDGFSKIFNALTNTANN